MVSATANKTAAAISAAMRLTYSAIRCWGVLMWFSHKVARQIMTKSHASLQPIDLSKTPIHIGSVAVGGVPFQAVDGFLFDGPSFGNYIADHCTGNEPGRLVMIETTPEDWATWERHTQGDEIVIVLDGAGTFYQELAGGVASVAVKAGDTLVNPSGVWHTADVSSPLRAIYMTPCPGTEHRAR